jgi:hypothetical protein
MLSDEEYHGDRFVSRYAETKCDRFAVGAAIGVRRVVDN